MKQKFYAKIEDGKLKFHSPDWVKDRMSSFKDGNLIITLETDNGKRTDQSNRYLHGVVFRLCFEALREAGFEKIKNVDHAKDFVKQKFLTENVTNESTGEVIGQITKHTADLSKEEMSEFIEDIAQWLAEYFSIVLPAPSSQSKLFAV